MSRKNRPFVPTLDPPADHHDLKLFISALVIGLVLGIAGSYLWHKNQVSETIAGVQAQASAALKQQQSCTKSQTTLQTQLNQCNANLRQAQLKPAALAAPAFSPSLSLNEAPTPKPKPPTGSQVPAPTLVEPVPPVPTPPLSWPKGIPPAPKPKPNLAPLAVPTPALELPAPPVGADLPVLKHTVPRPRPALIPPSRPEAAPETIPAPLEAAPPTDTLRESNSLDINVGDEKTISGSYKLRLIAVSQRKTGRYCVMAGNGLLSTRIASGKSQTVSWAGTRIVLTAIVEDRDTCRVTLRPAS